MFWKLPRRDLPDRYGPWKTVSSRFRRWSRERLFAEILRRRHLRLAAAGHLDNETWLADGTNIRAAAQSGPGTSGTPRAS